MGCRGSSQILLVDGLGGLTMRQHLLDFLEGGKPERTQFPPDTAALVAAPRRLRIDQLRRVDPHHAGLKRTSDPFAARLVFCDDRRHESVLAVIGHVDGLLFSVERAYAQDRAEDLVTP